MNKLGNVVLAVCLMMGWSFCVAGLAASPQSQGSGQQTEGGQQEKQGEESTAAAPKATAEEVQALQAIENELDPDKMIQMATDFEKKFPDSVGMHVVTLRAASAYQQKGDVLHAIEYGEKSIKLKGDNPVSLVLVASMLPQSQALRGSDLGRERKLAEAEEYANKAIQLIPQLPKQANQPEDQFNQLKASLTAWAHASLGMVHLVRSKMVLMGVDHGELAKAEQEYKLAVTISPRPDPRDYFRLGEAYANDGKIDEAIEAFSKASETDESGAIKALAGQQVERLKKAKSGAKPPAKP